MKKFLIWLRSLDNIPGKIIAILATVFLAASDFYSMIQLFDEFGVEGVDLTFFSLTMVFFLEVTPFLCGVALSEWADNTKWRFGTRGVVIAGFFVGIVAWTGATVLAIYMRDQLLQAGGGFEAFKDGSYGGARDNSKYIGEIFKMWSPLLTSVLAFLLSWLTFRHSELSNLQNQVRYLRAEKNMREKSFRKAQSRNKDARVSLWGTLADPDVEPMPKDFEVYRNQCFIKIREKLYDTCLSEYPTQVERFTSCVESKLAEYILAISQRSTLPQSISSITVQEMIARYEQQIQNSADAWDYNQAGVELEEELERALNNAVVVAQFHTTK